MLKSCGSRLFRFLKNEDGPTAVEYAVMLALIIVVCITAITTLGSNAIFGRVGGAATLRETLSLARPPFCRAQKNNAAGWIA